MDTPKPELKDEDVKRVSGGMEDAPPDSGPLADAWKTVENWWNQLWQ